VARVLDEALGVDDDKPGTSGSLPTMTKLRTRRPAASRPTTERSPCEQITIVM
jgi:hypothetical protein